MFHFYELFCKAQISGGNCKEIGGECWCYHDANRAIAVCGHTSGYSGKYYSLARASSNLPWSIITAVGKSPGGSGCQSNTQQSCDNDCATNRCYLDGCFGTDLSCWSDQKRWKRNGAGIVRCTNLEGRN